MMAASPAPSPKHARPAKGLDGRIRVPGDKSISHRALILGALAAGRTTISGLLEARDVLNTAECLRRLGVTVSRGKEAGSWEVSGVGVGGFAEPGDVLDFGNSGTGCRLMLGAIATTPITAIATGDASLCRRPMLRVLEPLSQFGATWSGRTGGFLPLAFTGAGDPLPVEYELAVPSAQVKSAMLLAALGAPGRSTVIEAAATRDHTERMLCTFGITPVIEQMAGGRTAITVPGYAELTAARVAVPADPSSAAFPLVAALIVPGSSITVEGVMLNPRRTGLFTTLQEMGADLRIAPLPDDGGETLGDVTTSFSALKGVEVPPERAPSMIDEFPILAVAASFAEGRTMMRGLAELRTKESDRLRAIVEGLSASGVAVEELEDGLVIEGCGTGGVAGGGLVATHMDHRIAMSFLVLGLAAKNGAEIDDAAMIATSFPDFWDVMKTLGADIGNTE